MSELKACPWHSRYMDDCDNCRISSGRKTRFLEITGATRITPRTPPTNTEAEGLAEELARLAAKAWPAPWRVGRQTGAPRDHIVDFGEPPSAPFFRLHEGSPLIGARPFGIAETDDETADEARAATTALIVLLGNNLPTILAALSSPPEVERADEEIAPFDKADCLQCGTNPFAIQLCNDCIIENLTAIEGSRT